MGQRDQVSNSCRSLCMMACTSKVAGPTLLSTTWRLSQSWSPKGLRTSTTLSCHHVTIASAETTALFCPSCPLSPLNLENHSVCYTQRTGSKGSLGEEGSRRQLDLTSGCPSDLLFLFGEVEGRIGLTCGVSAYLLLL